MANKTPLQAGCSYSEMKVYPLNWKTAKADMKAVWCIKFRFYEPGQSPYQVLRRCGNDLNTAEGRRAEVRDNLKDLKHLLEDLHWNPRTKILGGAPPPEQALKKVSGIGPHSSLRRAMGFAILKARDSGRLQETIKDMRGYCRRIIPVITKIIGGPVILSAVRRPHMIEALDQLAAERKWGAASFNNARAYLHSIWETLILHEVCEVNPIHKIKGREKTTAPRKILTAEERKKVLEALPVKPYFENAVHIFYSSGAREIELCYVKGEDVNLKERWFYVTIRKGATVKKVTKAITEGALPYWERQMENCAPEDYVFSDHFMPGPRFWKGDRFGRWWKRIIKIPLGIEADFYALKHLHTTEIAAQNEQMAADFNSHASTKMNALHYDVMSEKRKLEERKRSNVKL